MGSVFLQQLLLLFVTQELVLRNEMVFRNVYKKLPFLQNRAPH